MGSGGEETDEQNIFRLEKNTLKAYSVNQNWRTVFYLRMINSQVCP